MSIQEWAAIGEIVSAIAIVLSLIYVSVQLRQNTRATRVVTIASPSKSLAIGRNNSRTS